MIGIADQAKEQAISSHEEQVESTFGGEVTRRFALTISTIFSPPILTTAMFVILGIMLNNVEAWFWLAAYAFFSTAVPSLLILWWVRQGKLSDFHMANRDERGRPLMVIFLLSFSLSLVFYFGGGPLVITALAVGAAFQALVMWAVTTKWKISGHGAGAGSFLAILLGLNPNLLYLGLAVLALVIWARVRRSRHTLWQSIAGSALGFFSIWIPLQIIMPYCDGNVLACM